MEKKERIEKGRKKKKKKKKRSRTCMTFCWSSVKPFHSVSDKVSIIFSLKNVLFLSNFEIVNVGSSDKIAATFSRARGI